MSGIKWPRVVASGVLWAVVYDLVWGIAWFAFMRREWLDAVAAIKQPLPWTPDFWFVWAAVNLPIGVAIMAYVASRARSASALKAAVYAGVVMWLLMTLWMVGWSWQQSLSLRVIVLDSTVNLVGLVAASLAGGWSVRREIRQ